MKDIYNYSFPSAKSIVVSGDIHGDSWAEHDVDLMDDIKYERQVMDDIYNYLYTKNHPLRYWYYGHFHESWHAEIDDVMFNMLDIMELREIPSKDSSRQDVDEE